MYSGYYCKKCNIIPLIKPNLTDNKEIKFMLKCKCHINYLTLEQLNKNYYSKNIEQKNIINEKIMEDMNNNDSLLFKIEETVNLIKFNDNALSSLKNRFIDYLNISINKIDKLINKIKKINKYIEKIALIFINSYKVNNTNYSNIKNIQYIINNKIKKIEENDYNNIFIDNKIDLSIENILKYIDEIIPIQPHNEEVEFISKIKFRADQAFNLSNDLILLRGYSLLLFLSINNNCLSKIAKIDEDNLYNIDVDNKKNILCLYRDNIEILPTITKSNINSFKEHEHLKDNDIPKLIIDPIISFRIKTSFDNIIYWNDEKDNINKDKFIVNNEKFIHFFKYDLIKKTISDFFQFQINNYKIEIINYNNNKALLIFNDLNLSLFDLSLFRITKVLSVKFKVPRINNIQIILINTIQINNNEILITSYNEIYLVKLNEFKIKLKIEYESEIYHIFPLKDKSIIICGKKSAKRFSLKTFEIIGIFYYCRPYEFYTNYFENEIYYDNISNSLILSESRIILFISYNCELFKLTI